jgi:hypothetical protein
MFDPSKSILAATAALALFAGQAIADNHVTTTEGNMESAEQNLEQAGENAEAAAENAGEAAETAAEEAGNAVENAAEATGTAVENAAEATGNAVADAAAETSAAAESLAARVEAEFADIAGNPINDLLGTEIVTTEGEDVGEVEHFAMHDGKLVALAGIGGFLGLGEHDVALDFSRLMYNAEERHFVVEGYTQEELEALPEYDEEQVQIIEDSEMTLMQAAENAEG